MFFYFAKFVISILVKGKINSFEKALLDPEVAQKKVLKNLEKKRPWTEKTLFVELTSGSQGARKPIKYTPSLKRCFSEMFILWIGDVFLNAPIALVSGKVYMSISPRIGEHGGLNDDSDYTPWLIKILLKKFLAVSPRIQRVSNGNEFFNAVAKQLIACKDLEIISIWSPTYFLSLLDYIAKNSQHLEFEGDFLKAWPNLKMISLWTSGESIYSYHKLRSYFPNVWFQSKGLLATEGPMTLPWIKASSELNLGELPLVHLIYFEFLEIASGKEEKISNLKVGTTYEIIPYFPNNKGPTEIGDLVRCTGFYKKTPLLQFVGRKGECSDLVGEKLHGNVLRELFAEWENHFVVIPIKNSSLADNSMMPFYYIFLDECLNTLVTDAETIDIKMQNIHHYKLARELNQLGPIKIKSIPHLRQNISKIMSEVGINLGDQKDLTIIKNKLLQEKILLETIGH